MSSYAYCEKCGSSLPPIWELPIRTVVILSSCKGEAIMDLECETCGASYSEHPSYDIYRMSEELGDRMEELEAKLGLIGEE